MSATRLLLALAMAAPLGGCAGTPESTPSSWPSADRPIVIDRVSKTVRFAGIVPIVAGQRPMLEVLVCAPDSREHEALVMADIRPSHIHAALIAIGAEPGAPGGLIWTGERFEMREPGGPAIAVRLAPEAEKLIWTDARDWFMTQPRTNLPTRWLFTGSALDGDSYRADIDGTIVGLVSFATEVVGMAPAVSEVDAERGFDFVPVPDRVPPFGSRVFVELRLID